jgi:hypothetical protein
MASAEADTEAGNSKKPAPCGLFLCHRLAVNFPPVSAELQEDADAALKGGAFAAHTEKVSDFEAQEVRCCRRSCALFMCSSSDSKFAND